MMPIKKHSCIALFCLSLFAATTSAQDAPAKPPAVVALVAAVGDQIDIVRQRDGTSSSREPFSRKTLPVNGQALNIAVLRGLDRAIEEEEPQSRRVLLAWSSPPELAERLLKIPGSERETLVLQALKTYLQALPDRAGWDRIEAIVPSYFYESVKGMGRKLSGVGFYVQPLKNNAVIMQDNGDVSMDPTPDKNSDFRTVDPNTGDIGHSYTYIAPYLYFQRITLDARTLEVLARKRQFDSIKYADPKATAIDVGDQIPLSVMTGKLLDVVEQSAYSSVRGKDSVSVTVPRVVAPAASAAR